MRKLLTLLTVTLLAALVGCVTINVYFPAAAAQKAADQFIGSVIDQGASASTPSGNEAKPSKDGGPAASGGPSASVLDLLIPAAQAAEPNMRIHTPAIDAIHARMRKRFVDSLKPLLDDGVVGFTQNGLVAVRSLSAAPLNLRAGVKSVVAAENADRNTLYADIAKANGHPEWESRIRETFAQLWISRAHAGWYYRDSSGTWKRK
jgi:uncharacterized protein YdbL (DUF1318 family)